jgi:hypothetical protein
LTQHADSLFNHAQQKGSMLDESFIFQKSTRLRIDALGESKQKFGVGTQLKQTET